MMAKLRALGWGRLWTVGTPTPWHGEPWGFDSGIYADWVAQRPFDENNFMRRVERAYKVGRPYMAVTPDIVGGGIDSLEFSMRWLHRLPDWPWMIAVQDGLTPDMVSPLLCRFSGGIFLGGTNRFKTTASEWRRTANERGLPFHFARAGTPNKLQNAIESGAQSCDSSFPLWTMDRFEWFSEVWLRGHPQQRLPLEAA
jgi:hypothetical protein